jgi:FMN phosphatase YigB (HAD superfamily)
MRMPNDAPPLEAVLFDLDGTLLDLDGEAFLDAYVDHLAAVWGEDDPATFRQVLMASALAIFRPHPGATNGEVLRAQLAAHLRLPRSEVERRLELADRLAPARLRLSYRPRREAARSVRFCLRLGLRVVVATTPIYSPEVVSLRLRWARLERVPWALVTHADNMHTCKPQPEYFTEIAERLGLPPAACLVVGDDPLQDGPAAQAGMQTFILARDGAAGPTWNELAAWLTRRRPIEG